jgi:hypothetical protein
VTRLLLALLAALVVGVGGAATSVEVRGTATPTPVEARGTSLETTDGAVDEQPQVVLLGAPGLNLADLSPERTPTLWEMAKGGATANLVVRGGYLQTCGVDGWLSLGAGDRVAVPRPGSPDLEDPAAAPECPAPASDEIGAVAGWSEITELAP